MYYDYDHDQKSMNRLYEEHRTKLTRTYANGQTDALTLRLTMAKAVTAVGDLLVRGGQAMIGDTSRKQEQKLQTIRVHAGGNR